MGDANPPLRMIDGAAVAAVLQPERTIEALRAAFAAGDVQAPVRHNHTVPSDKEAPSVLLLMPAWRPDVDIGVKLVTFVPGNPARNLPSVHALYALMDGPTGAMRAVIDGEALTVRRTAAASALASSYLSRTDASVLLMVGAGALAPHLVRAHAAVRPIRQVLLWNRGADRAERLAADLAGEGLHIEIVDDLASAAGRADIISCATSSTDPLIHGEWLRPGTHLDLVGGFRPDMREADDTAVRRATLFVDTRAGCLAEAGDICRPIADGLIGEDAIAAELAELCRGDHPGRGAPDEITLFKSVGCALEDLAAAALVYAETTAGPASSGQP